jgi:hypothetical protein
LSFFFWPLCCLSFFDLRILITPLVSSNSCIENRQFSTKSITFYTNNYIMCSFICKIDNENILYKAWVASLTDEVTIQKALVNVLTNHNVIISPRN